MPAPKIKGILFPLQRDGRGDFVTSDDEAELVSASIEQIMGVRGSGATRQGEMPWRTKFGSQLDRLRHSNANDALPDIAQYFVVDAISVFEPRARLRNVAVARESTGSMTGLRINVSYTLRRANPQAPLEKVEVVTP